jgi:hypothetical protein
MQPLTVVRDKRETLFAWKLGAETSNVAVHSAGETIGEMTGVKPSRLPSTTLSSAHVLQSNGVFCALVDETCVDATSFAACVEGVLASWRHRLPSNLSSKDYLLDFAAELETCLGLGKQKKFKYALVGADDDNPDDNNENERFWRTLFEGDTPLDDASIVAQDEFRAAFAWIRGNEVHVLTAGAAQVQVVTTRARSKKATTPHTTEDAVQTADNAAQSVFKRLTGNGNKGNNGHTQGQPAFLPNRTLNWRYSTEDLDGSSRVTMLLTDVWSPLEVGALLRTAAEARGYASASGAVSRLAQQEFRTMRGAVAVLDVVPQELDKPDTDTEAASQRQSSTKNIATGTATSVATGVGAGSAGATLVGASSGGRAARAAFSGGTIALLAVLIAGVAGYFILTRSQKKEDDGYVPFVQQRSSTSDPNASPDAASAASSATSPDASANASATHLASTDTASAPFSVWTSPATKRRNANKPVDESWWYRARRNALMQKVTVSATTPLESTVATFFPISAMTLPFNVPPSKAVLLQRLRLEIQSFTKGVTTASLRWQVKPQDSIMAIARLPQVLAENGAAKSSKASKALPAKQALKPLLKPLLKPVNVPQPYVLAFNEPIKKGAFRLKFILPGVRDSVRYVNLNVFPSILAERSLKQLSTMKLLYGNRVAIRSKLIPEADSLKGRLKIRYAFLDQRDSVRAFDAPYSENFSGLHIPALAKKVRCQIVLASSDAKTPETIVWSRQIESIGFQPPEILADNVSAEAIDSAKAYATPDAPIPTSSTASTNAAQERKPRGRKPVAPRDVYVLVRGIRVDAAIPIDADLSNPTRGSKPIVATASTFDTDAEATIVFEESQLTIADLDGNDVSGTWKMEPITVSLLSSQFSGGELLLKLRVTGLPPKPLADSRRLRGVMTAKIVVRLLDRASGARLTGAESVVAIPVGVAYM